MSMTKDIIPFKKSGKKAQVITVSGGKGGIGKTFFSVNLSVELKRHGYKVLLFDADINLSNVNLMLHIDENNKFQDFLYKKIPIQDVIQKGIGGVDALYVSDDFQKILDIDDNDFRTIIDGLSSIEMNYDYIVIDTQAGLNELNISLLLNSDHIILITNPEITALVDLYKVIKITATRKSGINFKIIVNKALSAENAANTFNKISDTVNQFRLKTKLTFLGYILNDPKRVLESIQKRIPIVILHSKGNIRECFNLIVNSLLKNVRIKRDLPFFYRLLMKQ